MVFNPIKINNQYPVFHAYQFKAHGIAYIIISIRNSYVKKATLNRKLILGTYQSVLFFELDGARQRQLSLQIMGQ